MRVAVVGAGFAGLHAAGLLAREGAEVTVFEARRRLGGRCETVDAGGGAVYEAGGEWIDADHHRVLALLADHGLAPETRPEWPRRLVFRGEACSELEIWEDAMEDAIQVDEAAREMATRLDDPRWVADRGVELDARTLDDFLREHTTSPRGYWWAVARFRSDEGDDPNRIGLLGWLTGYRQYLERDGDEVSAYRFPGGTSALFDRMAAGRDVRLGAALRRVRQDAGGVTLTFDGAGEERFDRAVLTLPPPALEGVVFDPPLDVRKRCAVEACGMSRAIKIALEYDRPWWTESGWGGNLFVDGPVQQTWEGSLGGAPVLNLYVCGRDAMEWLERPAAVRAAAEAVAALFPDSAGRFERGWLHDWVRDPWARGAFSHLAPGYVIPHRPWIAPPEGRVHFAGEHTSTWQGFIEGALESAERAALEIRAMRP